MARCFVKSRFICWLLVFIPCLSVVLLFTNIPDELTKTASDRYIVFRNLDEGSKKGVVIPRTNLSSGEKEGRQMSDKQTTAPENPVNDQLTHMIGKAKNGMKPRKQNKEKHDILYIHENDKHEKGNSSTNVRVIPQSVDNVRDTSVSDKQLQQQESFQKPVARHVDLNAPGEMGRPVFIDPNHLPHDERLKYKEQWNNNHFNGYVSDMISLRRTLKDFRDEECKHLNYHPTDLPETSVIICFTDESWSALLRTVHSVLDRTPPHLLREIILVDDYSQKEYLKLPLDTYISYLPKVKILHATKRLGLIRARMWGADVAAGPVLFFLDSHCECAEGWLEPVLDSIKKDNKNVVQPVIDIVNSTTFTYIDFRAKYLQLGGFTWGLVFNWHPIPEHERKIRNYTDYLPIRSPTMAGGLFAISKAYFEYLGGYDEGFDIWGAENLELSFKIWMCGGKLLTAPCSHVGHVFRDRPPYTGITYDWLRKNNVRLAEVWLDDYKYYYYETINFNLGQYGDISERKALRKRLNCKSFEWFLDNIFPELFVPHRDGVAYGLIQNEAVTLCLYGDFTAGPIKVLKCKSSSKKQYWLMSNTGELRKGDTCLNYNAAIKQLALHFCNNQRGGQYWEYNEFDHFRHPKSNTCMELLPDGQLVMTTCAMEVRQRWIMSRGAPPFPSMPNFNKKKQ